MKIRERAKAKSDMRKNLSSSVHFFWFRLRYWNGKPLTGREKWMENTCQLRNYLDVKSTQLNKFFYFYPYLSINLYLSDHIK